MQPQVILLPDWFEGEIYKEGGTVTNPFSGQEFYLNNLELSMYDFIIGCNMLYELRGSLSDKLIGDMQKGTVWFMKNNPEAFYALID
jgi:hypothetical protein